MTSFMSQDGILQLNNFIFVLAVMQIVYSVLTMALGRAKVCLVLQVTCLIFQLLVSFDLCFIYIYILFKTKGNFDGYNIDIS
jgi:hypothetical protein